MQLYIFFLFEGKLAIYSSGSKGSPSVTDMRIKRCFSVIVVYSLHRRLSGFVASFETGGGGEVMKDLTR